jgi:RimJ/RimL family protein N-acetyltransferase
MAVRTNKAARKHIRIETERLLVRNARLDDASEQWGLWMMDAEASYMLNAPLVAVTQAEIETYIGMFDQKKHLLLVILEKTSGKILGYFRIDINDRIGSFLVSMIVGEPKHRHKGIMTELTVPFRDYFFERIGLRTMIGSVLSHNEPVIRYLEKTGLHLDKKIERHIKSRISDAMFDLCFFSQTAEEWRAWKLTNVSSFPQN